MEKNYIETRNIMNSISTSIANILDFNTRIEKLRTKTSEEISNDNFSNARLQKVSLDLKILYMKRANNLAVAVALVNRNNAISIRDYALYLRNATSDLSKEQHELKNNIDDFHKKYNENYYEGKNYLYTEDLKQANTNQLKLNTVEIQMAELFKQIQDVSSYLAALEKISFMDKLNDMQKQSSQYSTNFNQEVEAARINNRSKEEIDELIQKKQIHEKKLNDSHVTIEAIKDTQTILEKRNDVANNPQSILPNLVDSESNAIPVPPRDDIIEKPVAEIDSSIEPINREKISNNLASEIETLDLPVKPLEMPYDTAIQKRDVGVATHLDSPLTDEQLKALYSDLTAEFDDFYIEYIARESNSIESIANRIVAETISESITDANSSNRLMP